MILFLILACSTDPAFPPEVPPDRIPTPGAPHPDAAPVSPDAEPTGQIAYVAEDEGQIATWSIQADGTNPQRLSRVLYPATYPGPPDPRGDGLLLITAEDLPGEVHREGLLWRHADGAITHVTEPSGRIRNPAWAPDGSAILYEADHDAFRELYRVPRAGGDRVRLTNQALGNYQPAPGADGLLFASSRDGNVELYRLSDGLTRLTDAPGDDTDPTVSPDGQRVAFLSGRLGGKRLYVARASDGGAPRAVLPPGDEVHQHLAWHPDGKRLALTSLKDDRTAEVLVVDTVAGTILARTGGPLDDHATWSPDGVWLAFHSNRDGDDDLYIVRADGTDLRQLTNRPGADWLPRWLPEQAGQAL